MNEELADIEALDPLISRRYQIICKIGKGAYGIVWKATDALTQKIVALKKVFGAFRNSTEAQRIYREISYLKKLSPCPFIIQLYNVHRGENDADIYLVFEHMETDLHAVIRANILLDVHHRYIFWQIISALKYIHSANLIHRDLKPSNILINSDSTAKLCDFGLSRTTSKLDDTNELTDYITTRWYRAPEILLGAGQYTSSIDMWALGCILVELVTGKPLFPGTSTMDQIERIVAFSGPFTQEMLESMHTPFAATVIANVTYSLPQLRLEDRMKGCPPEAIDLAKKLLVIEPKKRLTAEECLCHPYLAQFHNENNERKAYEQINLTLDDDKKYTIRDYKNTIYREAVTPCDIPRRYRNNNIIQRN